MTTQMHLTISVHETQRLEATLNGLRPDRVRQELKPIPKRLRVRQNGHRLTYVGRYACSAAPTKA